MVFVNDIANLQRMTRPNAKTSSASTVLIILIIIFTFPIWIGILGGLFGLIAGAFGAAIGIVAAIIGAVFGVIGGMIGAVFGGWSNGHYGMNVFLAIALVLALVMLGRSRGEKK